MRSGISMGSVLALVVLAVGNTQAVACDDDCDDCGGYGYYAASYGYYARPAYAYAPGPYYATPGYAYYAPAYSYYAPAPVYYAPPPAYGYPYGRPYYGWRAGYVDAGAATHHRTVPAPLAARGMHALGAKPSAQMVKAPKPGYVPPAALKAPNPPPLPRGVVAVSTKAPKLRSHAAGPGVFAPAPKPGKPEAGFPVANYGPQPTYNPTAYYGGPGGYVGLRR